MEKARKAAEKTDEAVLEEQIQLKEINSKLEPAWDGTVAESFAEGVIYSDDIDSYKIENGAQLAYFSSLVNSGKDFSEKNVSIEKSINLGNREFTPIGLGDIGTKNLDAGQWSCAKSFKGSLNGNNNVITGLNINKLENFGVGLIGVLEKGGSVENIVVYEGNVTGIQGVGGVVGVSRGIIRNCYNSATIIAQYSNVTGSAGEDAGGIVGVVSNGSVLNCRNYGSVQTTINPTKTGGQGKYSGGIIGSIFYTTEEVIIQNCKNNGSVLAAYQQGGGIIGTVEYSQKVKIHNCENSEKVLTGTRENLNASCVGGIIGMSTSEVEITNCSNSGTITASESQAGGIIGTVVSEVEITNCSNSGTITATNYSGGIIGYSTSEVEITNCSNSGTITASESQAGGIIGYSTSEVEITNCSNSGTITSGDQSAGGISGKINGIITNCSNSGTITATNYSGGITSYLTEGNITNCGNSGIVIVNNQVSGGIAGRINNGTIESCINSGNTEASFVTGGIVGWMSGGEMNNCKNSGTITANNYFGGIVGYKTGGNITECYDNGEKYQ